eukprot:scaffold382_cov380-Prasinococcus_capsulatus_cf.AAC.41
MGAIRQRALPSSQDDARWDEPPTLGKRCIAKSSWLGFIPEKSTLILVCLRRRWGPDADSGQDPVWHAGGLVRQWTRSLVRVSGKVARAACEDTARVSPKENMRQFDLPCRPFTSVLLHG